MIPRHRVAHRSRMAFSKKIVLDPTLERAKNPCNLIKKSKSRKPGVTKRRLAQRDELACTRAGAAVLVV